MTPIAKRREKFGVSAPVWRPPAVGARILVNIPSRRHHLHHYPLRNQVMIKTNAPPVEANGVKITMAQVVGAIPEPMPLVRPIMPQIAQRRVANGV